VSNQRADSTGSPVLGADEAGKGPVIGPMVAAAIRADPTALSGEVDDSKRLSPARRESIATSLRSDPGVDVGFGVVEIAEIDDPATDMNSLTVAAQVRALAAVAHDGDRAVVDAGDVVAARFGDRVTAGLAERGITVETIAEHGADDTYPVVSAASVLAKVERDRRVDAIAAEYTGFGDVGSGYPSDPNTRKFLQTYVEEHGDVPACARQSWSTCADLLDAAAQSELDSF